jgi:hypothetical protein
MRNSPMICAPAGCSQKTERWGVPCTRYKTPRSRRTPRSRSEPLTPSLVSPDSLTSSPREPIAEKSSPHSAVGSTTKNGCWTGLVEVFN